tara:strand:+ start:934 stop:2157 length:1224 start_codon:yes stop_codon:yes gene_type:complete
MNIFGTHNKKEWSELPARKDFEFLSPGDIYLDSACQTLRPQPVLDAMSLYFHEYNACGGRVKYEWGKRVDEAVEKTRALVLKRIGKSEKEYQVAFTLNTTYGLNLLLQQLPQQTYSRMLTSDIEHNSVFLPTTTAANRLAIPRTVLRRNEDGSLAYAETDLTNAIAVVNATSSIDGRSLTNAATFANDLHATSGVLILDGAQSMVGDAPLLRETDFDALCFSSHKTYGPSLGVIVVKKQLLNSLELSFVGGGMVAELTEDSFTLPTNDPAAALEPGLQDFAGIIGLGAALNWLGSYRPEGRSQREQQEKLSRILFEGLSQLPNIHLLNHEPSSTLSFYSDDIDAHRLAIFLSKQNIMARSGYFCCHYYLQNVKKYPPLLRLSVGLHNTEHDVQTTLSVIKKIMKNIK